jgi:DNA-directed RNA polymerase sigma subunit (sigma70/sigma32)
LALDVNPETGSIKLNHPDREVWELEETCSLDVADRGGVILDAVGVLMNLTRQRISQLETKALAALKTRYEDEGDPR